MEQINHRLAEFERRLTALEQPHDLGDPPFGTIDGRPASPPNDGKLFPAVEALMRMDGDQPSNGRMRITGFHRTTETGGERVYQWQLETTSRDLLAMDDERNIRVLTALANPIRLRMMKAILQRPGTAAELRERLNLTSTGQTYHAINALLNGGMIRQDGKGAFEAVGDKASGFMILLGGLFNLTESRYRPAFTPSIVLDSEVDHSNSDVESGEDVQP